VKIQFPHNKQGFSIMRIILIFFITFGIINNVFSEDRASSKDSLEFIVIGDWGIPGSEGQKLVAAQMNELAASSAIDFIVTTGDNFYMRGVQSVDDPLWLNTFEKIYSLPEIKNTPWYVSLGNHDHMGNIYAQIEYGKNHANWILPQTYYDKEFKIGESATLQILFLDTSPFLEEYRARAEEYPNLMKQDVNAQIGWLDKTLEDSKNTWKIAVGHHPVYSAGAHGDTEELKKVLPELFERQKVDAYFAGHDHHLEHYQLAGKTHHFISGGGSGIRGVSERKQRHFAESSLGFAHVVLDKKCMQLSFIDEQGKELYRTRSCH
jgi:tartrate-resistant acid phosphatase type 5